MLQECCIDSCWNGAQHGHPWLLSNMFCWVSEEPSRRWRPPPGKEVPGVFLGPAGKHGPLQLGGNVHVGVRPFCSQMHIETLRENLYFQSKENLSATLEATLERTEDFTDSAYTSHEHRERILELSAQARRELQQLVSVWIQAVRTYFRQSKCYIIALP